ncbi:MAG: NCS2 family permease, partial [Candidatus Hydrogenedentes bacterium]|nr:NCS2 family permease [Candidatus Hydrogenedentota bacterium]
MVRALDQYFGITSSGSSIRREVVGGLTTFATMSYIVFVQPTVLSMAGMDFGSVLIATCLSSAFACVFMGVLARYPLALAPGMGENFLFAFTVCSTFPGGMRFSWQAGLMIVFISGVLFMLLSIFR